MSYDVWTMATKERGDGCFEDELILEDVSHLDAVRAARGRARALDGETVYVQTHGSSSIDDICLYAYVDPDTNSLILETP